MQLLSTAAPSKAEAVVWVQTSFDRFLVFWYLLFAFTALVFEPLFYYGCQWNAHTCYYASIYPFIGRMRDIWVLYLQYDPVFFVLPLWLRVLCTIEVWIFGPLYLLVAIGMLTNATWLEMIALPFSGALVYSTVVYFAMELLDFTIGTNLYVVFLVNLPWTIIPILLMYQIRHRKLRWETQMKLKTV